MKGRIMLAARCSSGYFPDAEKPADTADVEMQYIDGIDTLNTVKLLALNSVIICDASSELGIPVAD
jgi:hypothetical protein